MGNHGTAVGSRVLNSSVGWNGEMELAMNLGELYTDERTVLKITLPETNIAPENGWLFSGAMLVFGSVISFMLLDFFNK